MKFVKKIICILLCTHFFAAHADDYNFMQKAQGLVQFENTIMVPKEVLSLYHINLYSYVDYINTLELMIESSFSDLTNTYTSYVDSQTQIQNIIKNDGPTPSLDTLQKLIQYQMKSKFDSYSVENKVNNLQLIYNKIDSSRNILDNYCQNTSSKQDPNNFSLNTQNNYFNIPLHSNYTYYTDAESFAKDPHANAVGWLTFSAVAIAAIAVYCIATGTAVTAIIGISAAGVTFSGPAAVIVIVAAVIAFVAVDWYTENENERKQAEAAARTKELEAAMLAASDWYKTNSLFYRPDDFKKVALDLCQNQKTWKTELLFDDLDPATQAKLDPAKCTMKYVGGDGSDSVSKKVCEVDEENQFDKTTKNLNSYFTAFDAINYSVKIQSLKDNITKNESNIESVVTQYEVALTAKYTQDIIQSTQKKALSDSMLAQGINVYNTEIKENLHQKIVSDYISNMSNCSKLSFVINKDINILDSTANEITSNYTDDLNKNNSFFTTDLPADILQYKTTYLNDVNTCTSNSMLTKKSMVYLATNSAPVQDKIYDIKVPISFSYKDNVTDYSFSFVLENSDYLKYLQDGIFSFGLIGYFNSRDKTTSQDATVAANISALELDKISSALYSQSNLNMPKAPTTLNSLQTKLVALSKPSQLTRLNSSVGELPLKNIEVDNLSSEIDAVQSELNSGLTPSSLSNYTTLKTKINSLKQINQSNFTDFNNDLLKFNTLKNSFFYDDILIADKNSNKAPVLFYSSPTTLEGQALREVTNLCLANGLCTAQDNILSYLVLIDHYNPSSIFNLVNDFNAYFSNKSPESLSNLNSHFNQEISKSSTFQAEKTKFSVEGPFIKYELKNSSNILAQKYALQINDYSTIIQSTLQNSMNLQ